eukprot:10138793-Prorocentrum_lima.AAC.1
MSLTKASCMKSFLHIHGTTLKPDTNSESKDLKRRAKWINGMNMEAHEIPETDWTQYSKEQVLNQLETLSRKKLAPYAKT